MKLHFRHDGGSAIIDLVFTSEPETLFRPPLGSSDHQGIMVRFRKKKDVCLIQGRGRTIWRYNHADWERANQKISDMNLDQFFCGDDIDLCWTRAKLPDSLNPPWITKHILQLIRKRNTWYKKSCRNRESDLFRRYKVLCSKIHSLIRKSKRHYYESADAKDSKAFWKKVKLKKGKSSIPILFDGNVEVSERASSRMANSTALPPYSKFHYSLLNT